MFLREISDYVFQLGTRGTKNTPKEIIEELNTNNVVRLGKGRRL